MAETGLTKNRIISELARSQHGKLIEYVAIGKAATESDPEFMAHLVAWNQIKGQVRDAKVALPIVYLMATAPEEFADNALAHIALLGPREFLKAFRFALEVRPHGHMRSLRRLAEAYMREIESIWPKFERVAVQHRRTLKEIYALAHVKPAAMPESVLFKGVRPPGSLFEAVARLKDMAPAEAAGTIIERKIPFLIAMGALGKKAKEKDLVLALIGRMSPTELVTNTKMLEKLGIKTDPALRGAYEKAVAAASSSKANVLKTTRAAEAVEDEELKEKLRGMQERQIQALGGVDGNWLVLGDKSGSMKETIEIARQVSATLAKMVKGRVWLVFFDATPQTVEVTGKALDAIKKATQYVQADGGTSIGCGLQRMMEANEEVDGIAVISDAQENTPPLFATVYAKYCEAFGKQIPVYLYRTKNMSNYYDDHDLARSMKDAGHDLQEFDLTKGDTDYYSLPNLVATMRTVRYSLVDEIMATKLLRLEDVLKIKGKEVKAIAQRV